MSQPQELLAFLAKNLVDNPEQVVVTEVEKEDTITLELRVAQPDIGKIIGRGGRIARDLRTIVRSGTNESKKVWVEIIDTVE